MVAIRYEISEDAFKSQAFVGQMVAPEGATLLEALQRYEQQYPEVRQNYKTHLCTIWGVRSFARF